MSGSWILYLKDKEKHGTLTEGERSDLKHASKRMKIIYNLPPKKQNRC